MSSLNLVTAPTTELIGLDLAKSQCRVDLGDDDALIQGFIIAAREYVENYTGRQLVTARYELVLDGFCDPIDIPKAPLQSVISVNYVDTSGVTQTVPTANYLVTKPAGPTASRGRISRAFSTWWPITRYQADTVRVLFDAGYGDDASAVPVALIQAQLLLISHWYRNREPVIDGRFGPMPWAIEDLIGPYRTWPVSLA